MNDLLLWDPVNVWVDSPHPDLVEIRWRDDLPECPNPFRALAPIEITDSGATFEPTTGVVAWVEAHADRVLPPAQAALGHPGPYETIIVPEIVPRVLFGRPGVKAQAKADIATTFAASNGRCWTCGSTTGADVYRRFQYDQAKSTRRTVRSEVMCIDCFSARHVGAQPDRGWAQIARLNLLSPDETSLIVDLAYRQWHQDLAWGVPWRHLKGTPTAKKAPAKKAVSTGPATRGKSGRDRSHLRLVPPLNQA